VPRNNADFQNSAKFHGIPEHFLREVLPASEILSRFNLGDVLPEDFPSEEHEQAYLQRKVQEEKDPVMKAADSNVLKAKEHDLDYPREELGGETLRENILKTQQITTPLSVVHDLTSGVSTLSKGHHRLAVVLAANPSAYVPIQHTFIGENPDA